MTPAIRYRFVPDQRVRLAEEVSGAGAAPDRLIILSGFMGTGKSVVGGLLAARLGYTFLDMDEEIIRREGQTIPEIFAQRGEAAFRALETGLCRELAGRSECVIATGGGALLSQDNCRVLAAAGRIFLLRATPATIQRRLITNPTRPLLLDDAGRALAGTALADRIERLLAARLPIYSLITEQIDTDRLEPAAVAARIAARCNLAMQVITTPLPPGGRLPARDESVVEIGRGLSLHLGRRLRAHGLDGPVFLMIAEALVPLYQESLAAALSEAGLPWHAVAVADGDQEKTFAQVERILGRLADHGATRDGVAVTFGGGVTGDMAGFAASIYMRGMPLVQVPTTLLAQVDASIGGKMGVNHPRAKNLVGSFHPPHLVLIDPCLLGTLPRREIRGGMAEVVKTALAGSPDLFTELLARLGRPAGESAAEGDPREAPRGTPPGAPRGDPLGEAAFLERCVRASALIKSTIVLRDPYERGERGVLNLGHTAGHAFEAIAGYGRLHHGEAVAIGLVVAGHIACARGLWPAELLAQSVQILKRCGLPVAAPEVCEEAFLHSLHLDKKKRAGRLRYVLPLAPGCCLVVDDVSDEEILSAAAASRAATIGPDDRADDRAVDRGENGCASW